MCGQAVALWPTMPANKPLTYPSSATTSGRVAGTRVAGVSGFGRPRAGIPVRDFRGMKRGRRPFTPKPATNNADLQGVYGSDGTRTRDLRRRRLVPPIRRLATIDALSLYSCRYAGLSALTCARLR